MKFSITAIIAATGSLVAAAPTPSSTDAPSFSEVPSSVESSFGVPTEAIIGQFSFDADEYPLLTVYEDRRYIILLNSTIMEEAYASLNSGNEKRDAEAEAKWGWLRFFPGEPFVKRDAEADAEAKWGWLRFFPGEPFVKRDADAEAKWGWLRFYPGEPFVKREVEADLEG